MTNNNAKKNNDIQHHTKNAFLSLHIITACCHAVQNTIFLPPSPKPKWFDDLNSKLDVAKTNAAEWVNNIATEVTASVPAKVIDYGTTYDAITKQIVDIADKHPDASGKDNKYVKQVAELVDALLGSVNVIIGDVDTVAQQMKTWGEKMQKSHDDLSKGAVNIQNAEVDLQADIKKMNQAIDTLNQKISAENTAIAIAAGSVGVGVFLFIVGIALAPETGGASLIVSGVGALAVIGGAVTWGVMQSEINKQYDEIAKDQKQIAADKRQLVALKGLAQASDIAISSIAQATQALSDFRTSWGVFQGELQGTRDKLEKAEEALSVIVQKVFTQAAQEEWQLAVKFAQDLAEAKVEVQKKTLPMSGKAA